MSHDEIAKNLNQSQTTISRKIKLNTGQRGYRYQQAERMTNERQEKIAFHHETIYQYFLKNKILGGCLYTFKASK